MTTTEGRPPFLDRALAKRARKGFELTRGSAEGEYFGAILINNAWYEPKNYFVEGRWYIGYTYPNVPKMNANWSDGSREPQRLIEWEAANAAISLANSLTYDSRYSQDSTEREKYHRVTHPMWTQADVVVRLAQKFQQQGYMGSPEEQAAWRLYDVGRKTYKERILLEESGKYQDALSDVNSAVLKARFKDIKQVGRVILKTGVKSLFKSRTASAIDAVLLGGLPVARGINMLASPVRWVAYHAPRMLRPKDIFDAGRWVRVDYSEDEFNLAYRQFAKVMAGRPIRQFDRDTGQWFDRQFLYYHQGDPNRQQCVDAFMAALFLQQPERELVADMVGSAFLRYATKFVPEELRKIQGI